MRTYSIPRLSPTEFLEYIAGDFRIPGAGKTKGELLFSLGSYLIGRHQKNLTTVLVVDEAHYLSAELLEEIRLLTNLRLPKQSCSDPVGGTAGTRRKTGLDGPAAAQRRDRLRSHLHPLSLDETAGYIYRRLQIAGHSNPAELLPMDTIVEVHQQSRGIPRLINTLCENALICGYASHRKALLLR